MKASIIITTFNRPDHLWHSLRTIRRQNLSGVNYEIIVVDDGMADATKAVVGDPRVTAGLRIKYLHTGRRMGLYWRCMGFAANVGIRQAGGGIIVLTNSDIYHIGDTLRYVVHGCRKDPMALSTLHDVYDDEGELIAYLKGRPGLPLPLQPEEEQIIESIKNGPRPAGFYPCNPDVPFCLAVRKTHLLEIGGYDEDFIGVASEDCDLLDRLKLVGCHYRYAKPGAEAVHMYHGRKSIAELAGAPGFAHNIRLRNERKHCLVRNQGRNWGALASDQAPDRRSRLGMVLWVTDRCNLNCPLCNRRPAAAARTADYSMSTEELDHFISSCTERGIKFAQLELAGSEPTLWPLFRQAIERFTAAGIAERLTFATNGNDAEQTAAAANRCNLRYAVVKSRATAEQLRIHSEQGAGMIWAVAAEQQATDLSAAALPPECLRRHCLEGRAMRELFYLRGQVWYCRGAPLSQLPPAVGGADLCCHFDEDFPAHFAAVKLDKAICAACPYGMRAGAAPTTP